MIENPLHDSQFQPSVEPASKSKIATDPMTVGTEMRVITPNTNSLTLSTEESSLHNKVDGYLQQNANQYAEESNDNDNLDDAKLGLISSRVISNLLGEEHSGFRSFMYNIDPFKEEQFLRAPKNYKDINFLFAMVYFLGVFSYAIWAIVYYTSLPPLETTSTVLASTVAPVTIKINTKCSVEWSCGKWSSTGTWLLEEAITVTQVWEHVGNDSPCKSRNGDTKSIAMNKYAEAELTFELCSSSSNLDGIYLKVPFNKDDTYGSGDIFLTSELSSSGVNPHQDYHGMKNTQQLALGELKSVYLSQTVYKNTIIDETSQEPYVADLFYDGHTSSSYGRVGFKSQQFTRLIQVQSASSIMSLIGTVGGFAGILLTTLAILRMATLMIYIKYFVPDQSHEDTSCNEKVADFCNSCFSICETNV